MDYQLKSVAYDTAEDPSLLAVLTATGMLQVQARGAGRIATGFIAL